MSSELVRSYLLGTLEENSAASVEERYFTDREFFLYVQAVETALIEDYLCGRLSASIKSRFEARYLSVPDLRRRLEEVRQQQIRAAADSRRVYGVRSLQVAAIVLVCIGGAIFWLYSDHFRFQRLPTQPTVRPILATLALSPGVSKGDRGATLALQKRDGDVELDLEIPGQRTQLLCSVEVLTVLADGGRQRVWLSPQLLSSHPFQGGQQVTLILASSLLPRGDYLVDLIGADSAAHETYVFRVSPP